jgi:hypothetical protein
MDPAGPRLVLPWMDGFKHAPDLPQTNEYGLASALDLPQTNECRAYRCPRGRRSIRVRDLVDDGSVPRMSSAP